MKFIVVLVSALVVAGLVVSAQQPEDTREEQLLRQVATLQMQLAQMTAAWHGCEANGPAAAQLQRQGQATVQELRKSLHARGLTLDKDGNAITAGRESQNHDGAANDR